MSTIQCQNSQELLTHKKKFFYIVDTATSIEEVLLSMNHAVNTSQQCMDETRGQSNLTKSASRGAHSPVRGHPRGSKVVPLNSWGRVSY